VHVVSMLPADGQGQFSTDPALATPVDREQQLLRLNFSGPIDCAQLKHLGSAALRVYTTGDDHPNDMYGHDMFHNPDSAAPGSSLYTGHITCSGDQKQVTFHIPGRLYGGTVYKVRVRVPTDASGHFAQAEDYTFQTENPGLRVKTTMVKNNMSYDCDSKFLPNHKYCDTYIAMIGSWTQPGDMTAHTWPGSVGTYNDWLRSEIKFPDATWLEAAGPIADDALLIAQAFDSDGNDKAANILHVAAAVHGGVAGVMTAFQSPYAAIPAAVGAVLEAVALAIQNNDDDNLGRTYVRLSKSQSNPDQNHVGKWWGTYGTWDSSDPYTSYGYKVLIPNGHGNIELHYTVDEYPAAWAQPAVVL
jgi:hypothetical protein